MQVDITVSDENDNKPEFVGPVLFSVPENSPVQTLVGTLSATDEDIGSNAVVTFTSPNSGPFNVMTNGEWAYM